MLGVRSLVTSHGFIARAYATATSPHALVLLEHKNGTIESGSLSALTAAQQLGGTVAGIVIPTVLEKVKKLTGLSSVLYSSAPQYSTLVPEIISPLLEKLLSSDSSYTHVVSSHSYAAKSLIPRIVAKLNVPAFFTVRSTAFIAAPSDDGASVALEELAPVQVAAAPTQHIKADLTQSDRPELGVATRVVSGGRAFRNAETFKAVLNPLADALGAAVGASRATVDAGYTDNSLQVGQTGKVVAPELYVAVGISGATQHLAGMKDSKLIVAINNGPDAPIFQVADIGLVADHFEAVPQIVEKLKQ
ncbi:electron transfer flavoprotein alpha subunit [Lactifluus subvellereus]|nr:electron transfer flavoprotein alpha subunit [Lactifluus subvellereus]